MNGQPVAVKTIGSDCIENFNTFEKVGFTVTLPTPLIEFLILAETVHQRGYVEAP